MSVVLACLPFVMFIGWPAWWLAKDALVQRRKRKAAVAVAIRYRQGRDEMGKHDGHQYQAVSVAELMERAAGSGRALRLNWSVQDTDPHGFAALQGQDWPTGVLPRMTDELMNAIEQNITADSVDELPQREPQAIPAPLRPLLIQRDTEFLERVLDGLRRLDQDGTR